MKAPTIFLSLTALALLAAGLHHASTRRTQAQLEADTTRLLADAIATRRLSVETSRQREKLAAEQQTRLALTAAKSATPSPTTASPLDQAKSSAPPSPELGDLQVQAVVSEQRLRYAGLLKRLGFTGEKLQAFDQIQRDFQRIVLDESQASAARQKARGERDARLKELFGTSFDQWVDATRTEPARALVAQIVQQTFSSSGALTTAQADQLASVIGKNRLPSTSGPTRYDWDRIITDARSVLVESQLSDFAAAVQYRRASEEMSAIASKKKL